MQLIIVCWIFFLAYWVFSAPYVKPTKEARTTMKNTGWNLVSRMFLGVLLVLSLVGLLPNAPFTFQLFPITEPTSIVGFIFVVVGLMMAVAARKILADNWSANVEIKNDHELITTGVYSLARHPIYTGVIAMTIGTFVATASIPSLIIMLICGWFLSRKLVEEEVLLTNHFPHEYPAYQKRVKSLIPFLY